MRPTFLAFQTASRAMAASQANIDVTGNNIANMKTDGYTRQRVDQSSFSNSGYVQRYSTPNTNTGLGVVVTGISQIRDPFLDARYRAQNAETSQYETLLAGLSDLENVIDEASTEKLQTELSNFINQLQTFSGSSTSKDLALVVRTAAQKITQILNVYSDQINEVRDQQIYDLSNVVINTDFNATVKSIADLNTQIRSELVHGNTPNELYDQRNLLIDKLSGMANIKVTTTPEKVSEDLTIENLNISIYDTSAGKSIGIVQNGSYNTLSAALNETTNQMEINISSSFGGYHGNVSSIFSGGGSINGYLNLINGNGTYADTSSGSKENNFRGTLYYQSSMNTFASNFAKVLNDLNTDSSGTAKPLFSASDGTGKITAGNIAISDQWLKDAAYITTTTNTNTGTSGGEGDNIARMIYALNNDMKFYRDPDDPSSEVMFEGTVHEYVTGTIGELSLDVQLHENFNKTSASVLNKLDATRESISGVNLDEEGIQLMAFQKSYNAAARFFNVLDEAVDKIVNEMGLVGR